MPKEEIMTLRQRYFGEDVGGLGNSLYICAINDVNVCTGAEISYMAWVI